MVARHYDVVLSIHQVPGTYNWVGPSIYVFVVLDTPLLLAINTNLGLTMRRQRGTTVTIDKYFWKAPDASAKSCRQINRLQARI